jgi:hypothetical protein
MIDRIKLIEKGFFDTAITDYLSKEPQALFTIILLFLAGMN